jgi:tRNA-specific 2-thiouridylase
LYVISIDIEKNKLVAGPEPETYAESVVADQINYVSGTPLTEPIRVAAMIRYNAQAVSALVTPLDGGRVRVDFDQPQRAVTPGQSVVLYAGEEVLGGAIISG